MYVCVSISVSLCISLSLYVSMCLHLYLSVYVSQCVYVAQHVCLSASYVLQSMHVPLLLCVCVCIHGGLFYVCLHLFSVRACVCFNTCSLHWSFASPMCLQMRVLPYYSLGNHVILHQDADGLYFKAWRNPLSKNNFLWYETHPHPDCALKSAFLFNYFSILNITRNLPFLKHVNGGLGQLFKYILADT